MAKIIVVISGKGGAAKQPRPPRLPISCPGEYPTPPRLTLTVRDFTNKLEVTIHTLIRRLVEDMPLPPPESCIFKTECGLT